jgi:hypothetical protein
MQFWMAVFLLGAEEFFIVVTFRIVLRRCDKETLDPLHGVGGSLMLSRAGMQWLLRQELLEQCEVLLDGSDRTISSFSL